MRAFKLHVAGLLLLAVLFLMSMHGAFAQGRRVALIVGNSAYRSAPQLANPANDAQLLATTLRALGFTLIGGGAQLNLGKADFDTAVQDFGKALQGAEVALFYYAGHGMQVQGTNWLVPLDANPSRVQDLDVQMVDASRVLKYMETARTKLNVLILDACRNNPFIGLRPAGGETGLAQMLPTQRNLGRVLRGSEPGLAQMRAPEGTVIAFATQPGNVARDGSGANSPYTTALAEAMRQRGLNVLSMFNRVGVNVKRSTGGAQQPWVSNSPIEGEYFFAGPGSGAMGPSSRPSATLYDRISEKARAENMLVPPFINIVAPTAALELARFVGAWGPGTWGQGERPTRPGDQLMIIIEAVQPSGDTTTTVSSSGMCVEVSCAELRPGYMRVDGKIVNGRLALIAPGSGAHVTFEVGADGQIHGTRVDARSNGTVHILLRKIE